MAALFTITFPAIAQQSGTNHSAHHTAQAQSASALGDGEVRKVDKDAKNLTIRHDSL
jgi:Cu/Ag efflux protein CusF